jgi:hypothetical protein
MKPGRTRGGPAAVSLERAVLAVLLAGLLGVAVNCGGSKPPGGDGGGCCSGVCNSMYIGVGLSELGICRP